VTVAHSCAYHSRAVSLISKRSKHSRHDLVIDSCRPKDVEHILEVPFITERPTSIEFVDGIDGAMCQWVSGPRKATHQQALSVCERASGDLALSRYRTKGERYPIIRGRNVNILV
jgi:hypothetical protein